MAPPADGAALVDVWRAPQAEIDLVGALIVRPALWTAFDAALIDTSLFQDERARAIFIALAALAEQAEAPAISLTSTITSLKHLGLLDQAGGPAFVSAIVDGHGGITTQAVSEIATHLRALERCRWFYYATGRILGHLKENPSAIARELAEFADQAGRGLRGRTRRAITDSELALLTPPPYLLAPYLVARSFAVLYAPAGVGKTFLGLALACALLTRKPFLGLTPETSARVLYVPGEGRAAMAKRIDAWKLHHGVNLDDPIGLHLWDGALHLLDPLDVRACIAEARDARIELLILDTWQRCLGADENATADVSAGVAAVDRIRDAVGAAVLVIHHTGLATERERGNTALRASADTMLALKQEEDLRLRLEKQRDGLQWPELPDLVCRLVPQADAGSLVCVADDGTPVKGFSASQLKAIAALRGFPVHEGATKSEWCESCAPMAKTTFYRTAAKLVSQHVVAQARSRYRFTASYRDSNGGSPEEDA